MSCNNAILYGQDARLLDSGPHSLGQPHPERTLSSRKSSDEFSRRETSKKRDIHGTHKERHDPMGYLMYRERRQSDKTTLATPVDIVYCSPRPIIFPYHNDGYFLPLAEPPILHAPSSRHLFDGSSTTSASTPGFLRRNSSYSFLGRLSQSSRAPSMHRQLNHSRSMSSELTCTPELEAIQPPKKSFGLIRSLFQNTDTTRSVSQLDIDKVNNEQGNKEFKHKSTTPQSVTTKQRSFSTTPVRCKTTLSMVTTASPEPPVKTKLGTSGQHSVEDKVPPNTPIPGHHMKHAPPGKDITTGLLPPTPEVSQQQHIFQSFTFTPKEPTISRWFHHCSKWSSKASASHLTPSSPQTVTHTSTPKHKQDMITEHSKQQSTICKTPSSEPREESTPRTNVTRRIWKRLKGMILSKKIKANRVGVVY